MDFDCRDMAGEFEDTLKGFTRVRAWVDMGPRAPGCSNAKADQNIDITKNVHTLPAMKQMKISFSLVALVNPHPELWTRTSGGYRPPRKPDFFSICTPRTRF